MTKKLGFLAFLAIFLFANAFAQPQTRSVMLVQVEGVIGPPVARHVEMAIDEAEARGAEALIIEMNTPGGLETSMRDVIADILRSGTPVIGYVAPSGARAASAGTFILYATHVAAMAPATNVGAATPVDLAGAPEQAPESPQAETEAPPEGAALERKALNDAAAFIRSLADLRGRNADWAERAVRDADAISAREALERGVIEIIATDIDDLLAQLDQRVVTTASGRRTLSTANVPVERIEPTFFTRVLSIIANPNVALLLMMVGLYGVIYEFASPGSFGPGIIGAICLVLGLYALNQLPLNYAGLALIFIGIGLMVAEAFTPSFGVLGVGGAIAFLVGAGMLIETDIPAYQLSWGVILAGLALTGGFVAVALGYALRAHRRPVVTGREGLKGNDGEVISWSGGRGTIWIEGERWNAHGPQTLKPGDKVRVEEIDGLTLRVTPRASQGD
jgi:membrane-bound serine protease (ClpP class)